MGYTAVAVTVQLNIYIYESSFMLELHGTLKPSLSVHPSSAAAWQPPPLSLMNFEFTSTCLEFRVTDLANSTIAICICKALLFIFLLISKPRSHSHSTPAPVICLVCVLGYVHMYIILKKYIELCMYFIYIYTYTHTHICTYVQYWATCLILFLFFPSAVWSIHAALSTSRSLLTAAQPSTGCSRHSLSALFL